MNDLISRQAALDCFHDWIDKNGDVHTADEMPEYNAIYDLPSTQPEIIMCRDCRHCNLECGNNNNQYYSCMIKFNENGFWIEVGAKDFCSFAERRIE